MPQEITLEQLMQQRQSYSDQHAQAKATMEACGGAIQAIDGLIVQMQAPSLVPALAVAQPPTAEEPKPAEG